MPLHKHGVWVVVLNIGISYDPLTVRAIAIIIRVVPKDFLAFWWDNHDYMPTTLFLKEDTFSPQLLSFLVFSV